MSVRSASESFREGSNDGPRTAVPARAEESARAAGLVYLSDRGPGIRRRRAGRGFTYHQNGRAVREAPQLARFQALAIPPAWTEVWICPSPRGHIQATGRDSKRRKQYRYHARWRDVRDQSKYGRVASFGQALPLIRRRTERDLRRPGLPREKVLALVVRLLESTLIRIGNDEYARDNDSYGLTTLRSHHVDVAGSRLRFRFRGKSGKEHVVGLQHPQLSRVVKRCQELPGQELFQYLDRNGHRRRVGSTDVNRYLREATGRTFTAKDFRTWAGTLRAAWALGELDGFRSQAQARRNVSQAVEQVARRLGNTTTVCRRCYVHPAVIDAYLDGSLRSAIRRLRSPRPSGGARLGPHESAVLALLAGTVSRARSG